MSTSADVNASVNLERLASHARLTRQTSHARRQTRERARGRTFIDMHTHLIIYFCFIQTTQPDHSSHMCPHTLTTNTHTPQPPRQGALFVSAPLWSATRGRHEGVRPMHVQKQKKMYMLARSLRTCERKSIDAALLRLDEPLPSFGPEVVTDAHAMLVKEKRMRIDWATLPSAVDPHSTTWRGSSIPGDGSVDTTSHATMRKTINPRSERKRAQVENFASMLSAAAPPAGSRVVDFGAGSGNLVLPLASLFPQATLGNELELTAIHVSSYCYNVCCHTATTYVSSYCSSRSSISLP